ncbi:hypothetical protein ACR3K2_00760 [Cryptosporidium serpentis]
MRYLTSVDIQQKVDETGFDWRTGVEVVETLVGAIKHNINKIRVLKDDSERKFTLENSAKDNDSGIVIIPNSEKTIQNSDSKVILEYTEDIKEVYKDSDIIIFEDIHKTLNEGDYINEVPVQTPLPSPILCDKIGNIICLSQKSVSINTSSSATYLSKSLALKKRKLIVPPVVRARRCKNSISNKYESPGLFDLVSPKRKLKLRDGDISREYPVFRDEDLGVSDNTDEIFAVAENIHKQDDDRQTTSEIQEWAIGLVRRYLGETTKLVKEEISSKSSSKLQRVRALRQRFGFSTKTK